MTDFRLKERVIHLIEQSDDATLLEVEELLTRKEDEEWSKEESNLFNKEVDQSEKEIMAGNFITHEELLKRMQSW